MEKTVTRFKVRSFPRGAIRGAKYLLVLNFRHLLKIFGGASFLFLKQMILRNPKHDGFPGLFQ
jgi:hypothetical protein